ncbi:HAMP domain-containing protein [Alloactinosynnema sp. L-07]|uniref:HAMP domain-containing protein n=1 Tax=Alloactinosynnema sp. L-07 TaxID=1653480 RepID=UPI0006B57578|nr:HAMP domain-containing protein [Alloactinosynnema sp. L-07]
MERQIPETGFPSNIGGPALCLLVLLLGLAALTGILLDHRGGDTVPRAFIETQERLAADIARGVGASAKQGISDLRLAAAQQRADAPVEPLLDKIAGQSRWRGAAVLGGPTRALMAARGEQFPVNAVGRDVRDVTLGTVVAGNGDVLLVTTVALPGDRLLSVTSAVRLPDAVADPALGQALHLTTLTGQVVAASRSPHASAGLDDLITRAGQAAAGAAGSLLGPVTDGIQATVGYAAVAPAGGAHALDLAVVTVGNAPTDAAGTAGRGMLPAAALAAISVGGYLVLRVFLIRPVRRLRADILAVAGGNLNAKVHRAPTREVTRIAATVADCRDELRGKDRPVAVRGMPAVVAVAIVAAAILAWSGTTLVTTADQPARVPDVLVTSLRDQTGRATDALRRSVNDGLADLSAVVTLHGAEGPDAVRDAARQLVLDQPRYRSVYLVDQSGGAQSHAGRTPLRSAERASGREGIRQQNSSGRVPVIFAHVPLPDETHTLIGEFDVDHLADLLRHAPGRVRLVDADFRTISATGGYVAFAEVTDQGLRDNIALAQRGDTVADIQSGGESEAIVASAAVHGGDAGKLGWTVLSVHPVQDLALPANDLRRHTEMVALVAALLALLLFGWHLFLVIKPLRRLAAAADRIADGDRDTVIYPQRHDEIGTIAACLEICRQAVTEGRDRLGEVRRPRGAATAETMLMRPVDPPAPRGRRVTSGRR